MKKRFLSCFLSLSLLLTMMPTMAFAADDEVNEPEGTVEVCVETEGCTLEAGHEGECVVVESEPEEPESILCTVTEGCTLENGHEGECVVAESEPEEPESVPCTVTEGCTLEDGHEGGCVVESSVDSLSEDEEIVISITEADMNSADEENPPIKSAIARLSLADPSSVTQLKVVTEGEAYLSPEDNEYIKTVFSSLNYLDESECQCSTRKLAESYLQKSELPDVLYEEFGGLSEYTTLNTLRIPESAEVINSYSINKTGITSLNIPNSVLVIESGAFSGNTNFVGNLVIPDSVVFIGNNSFGAGNELIKCGTLTLGNSVKYIDANGFKSRLFEGDLIIPDSVEYIGNWVFTGPAFKGGIWTLGKNLRYIGDASLSNICSGNEGTLFVPAQLDAKDTAFGYNTFSKVVFEEGTTAVSARVVRDSTSIEEVVLPSTIITIGTGAFSNCSSLSKVFIPDGVTTINNYAFESTALSGVFVPATVKSIGLRAFEALPQNSVVYVENNDVYQLMIADHSDQWKRRFDSNRTALAVTNGGTFAEDTEFTSGSLAKPAKIDYIFDGWYTQNGTDDNEWGDKVDSAVNNNTYYAKWTACDHGTGKAYTATGAVITEKCSACGHVFGTATISAPTGALIYDGTAKTAIVTISEGWEGGRLAPTYNGETSAPVNAGTYTASITVGDATATVEFTIEKAEPELSIIPSNTELSGGGNVILNIAGAPDENKVTVTCNNENIEVTKNADDTYTATLPNETANYTFTAKYDGDQNHEMARATCTVYVTRHTGGGGASHPEAGDNSSSDRNDRDDDDTENIDEEDVPLTEGKVADFDDVPADAWFAEAVQYVYEHDLMTGVSENLFAPNAQMNRAMVAQILFNVEKPADTEAPAAFRDVAADQWYAKAVNWAVWQGYMSGYGAGSFGPNDALTREQLVTVLWRYSGSPVMGDSSMLNTFSDAAMTSDYAQQAMTWAYAQGVISGNADGTLNPQGTATRAEVATILMRFYENMAE